MRVGVVFFENGSSGRKVRTIADALAGGIEKQGHQVDVLDGFEPENKKVSFYDYICIGSISRGVFSAKLVDNVASAVKNLGLVSGKRSYAFTVKRGIRSMKTLSLLMKIMEEQGLYLKRSDVIKTAAEAEYIGRKLHITR